MTSQLISQLISKLNAEIIRTNNGITLFKVSNKAFSVSETNGEVTVYRAYIDSKTQDVQLMPGFVTGKSFRTVSNFVNSRI